MLVLRLIAGFGMSDHAGAETDCWLWYDSPFLSTLPPILPLRVRRLRIGVGPHRGGWAAQWRQVFGMTTMMANFDGAHAEKKLAAMGAGLSKL